MQYAVNMIRLGIEMLGLHFLEFPITISRMKKFYGALNFLRNANRLLVSERAIILLWGKAVSCDLKVKVVS